jgi:hypothetical protein
MMIGFHIALLNMQSWQQPNTMLLQFWSHQSPGTIHCLWWTGHQSSPQQWWWHELAPSMQFLIKDILMIGR